MNHVRDALNELPWARWWQRRCRARRERRGPRDQYGRCDLVRGHLGDHTLERSFDTPRWSTDWTDMTWKGTR